MRYQFIHIEDLSDAFVLCTEKDEAVGETFIIADDHAITLNEGVRIIANALGVHGPRLRLPYPLLYYASAVSLRRRAPVRGEALAVGLGSWRDGVHQGDSGHHDG